MQNLPETSIKLLAAVISKKKEKKKDILTCFQRCQQLTLCDVVILWFHEIDRIEPYWMTG